MHVFYRDPFFVQNCVLKAYVCSARGNMPTERQSRGPLELCVISTAGRFGLLMPRNKKAGRGMT